MRSGAWREVDIRKGIEALLIVHWEGNFHVASPASLSPFLPSYKCLDTHASFFLTEGVFLFRIVAILLIAPLLLDSVPSVFL